MTYDDQGRGGPEWPLDAAGGPDAAPPRRADVPPAWTPPGSAAAFTEGLQAAIGSANASKVMPSRAPANLPSLAAIVGGRSPREGASPPDRTDGPVPPPDVGAEVTRTGFAWSQIGLLLPPDSSRASDPPTPAEGVQAGGPDPGRASDAAGRQDSFGPTAGGGSLAPGGTGPLPFPGGPAGWPGSVLSGATNVGPDGSPARPYATTGDPSPGPSTPAGEFGGLGSVVSPAGGPTGRGSDPTILGLSAVNTPLGMASTAWSPFGPGQRGPDAGPPGGGPLVVDASPSSFGAGAFDTGFSVRSWGGDRPFPPEGAFPGGVEGALAPGRTPQPAYGLPSAPVVEQGAGPAPDLSKTNDLLQQLLDEVRKGRQGFLPLGSRDDLANIYY